MQLWNIAQRVGNAMKRKWNGYYASSRTTAHFGAANCSSKSYEGTKEAWFDMINELESWGFFGDSGVCPVEE